MPDVVVLNQGTMNKKSVLEVTKEEFDSAMSVNAWGSFAVAQAAARAMVERGSGTIIFTGATAALRGGAEFSLLAMPKFTVRALSQSLAREIGPKGVHVAHVVVDGLIAGPRTEEWGFPPEKLMDPLAMGQSYLHLAQQSKSAWTQELDLRPYNEKW